MSQERLLDRLTKMENDRKNKKSVAAVTLGCKLNYAETSSILDCFIKAGWKMAGKHETPDLIVIHTCAVTKQAEQKSRQQIRRAVRRYPESRVVVIGCYATLSSELLAGIDGVAAVLEGERKYDLSLYRQGEFPGVRDMGGDAVAAHSLVGQAAIGRTRAFLKIQDGCSFGCAYCTIPLARGRSRSVAPEEVLAGARRLLAAGYRELVVTGVNIGDYRHGSMKLADLLVRLDELPAARIRISSVEPDLLNDRLLETVARSTRIMPHFHLPLQGGTNGLLMGMRRHYTLEVYRERLLRTLDLMPACGVGADIMTGYPGEKPQDFEAACSFLASLPVSYLHVFPCSIRPGTLLEREVRMGERGIVQPERVREQSRRLVEIGEEKKRKFAERFIGRETELLIEEQCATTGEDVCCSGYTPNYIRVQAMQEKGRKGAVQRGDLRRVRLTGIRDDLDLEGVFVT
ncbi:Threonylcarbamoyladenosine tRNA methylthiotransferase MtaB [Prosthecochloris sp. CIB 2401]|nr:Threonylcarbamoyladenosine tRNA methylthiotransferase MtaB [Prosthecochloris sp. CIB 2401]